MSSDTASLRSSMVAADAASTLRFTVRSADISMKITLDEKWQRRSFCQAVIEPFIKTYNKKAGIAAPLQAAGLRRVLIDGAEAKGSVQSAVTKVVSPNTGCVELVFGVAPSTQRQFWVRCGTVELKITLDAKWLQRSFLQAVVQPFVKCGRRPAIPAAAAAHAHAPSLLAAGPTAKKRSLSWPRRCRAC